MYKVYINYFKRNNQLVATEELMLTVPSINGFPIQKPIVKASEDSAENFSFTMDYNSPYYDALLQFKTRIRVVYDGPNGTDSADSDTIFYGKVLNITTSTVYNTKNITCAGYFAFFNDTYYEGKQETSRAKISVSEYYARIIANHNMYDPSKSVTIGTTGVTLPSDLDRYEPSAWTQTSGLLSNLTSNYGGHMKVRISGYTAYLDWYKYYARDLGDGLRPVVKIGRNILDLSCDYGVNDIFTRVIPTGATNGNGSTIYIEGYKPDGTTPYGSKAMPVTYMRTLYTDQELTDEFHNWQDYRDAEDNYGIIYKPVSFPNANTQEKLWNETKKWIKESWYGIAPSFTVKAIDMHILNNSYPKIVLGECVDVMYKIVRNGELVWETKKLVCKSVSYDLFNPENNSYTFGIPTDLLDHSRTSKKSSKSTPTVSGNNKKPNPTKEEDENITWNSVFELIYAGTGNSDFEGHDAGNSFEANKESKGTVMCYDPDDMPNDGTQPYDHQDLWFIARNVGKITLPGKTTKYVAIASSRGIFAYEGRQNGCPVVHWYSQHKNYKYNGEYAGLTTFEVIARLIELDTDQTYGGQTVANQFRTNGPISGTVSLYDPTKTDSPATHKEYVFEARIVGKFGTNPVTWVASADNYGIFAYRKTSAAQHPITHWYQRVAGITYVSPSNLIETPDGKTYTTDDGSPDGNRTIEFGATELTGLGSEGKVLIGYDLRTYPDYQRKTYAVGERVTYDGEVYCCRIAVEQAEDFNPSKWELIGRWQVKINTPIAYRDKDGNDQLLDGFIRARDVKLDEIPSFKTKLAVMDTLIAGKITAGQLTANGIEADIAYIRHLNSGNVVADTSVYASFVRGSTVRGDHIILNVQGSQQNPTGSSYLDKCYSGAFFTESNGVITLNLTCADGSRPDPQPSFNMAATQFYLDEVAAAKNLGWNNSRDVIKNSLPTSTSYQTSPDTSWRLLIPKLNYNSGSDSADVTVTGPDDFTPTGSTTSIKVYKVKIDGQVAYIKSITDSNLTPSNIRSGVEIFGKTGNLDPTATGRSAFFTLTTLTPMPGDTLTIDAYYVGEDGNLARPDTPSGTYTVQRFISKTLSIGVDNDTGWNAARDVIKNSLPTSTSYQTSPDTSWRLLIPKLNYNSGSDSADVTVTGPDDFTPTGSTTSIKVYKVKIDGQVAYIKSITDSNLTPSNIRSGVEIFGKTGNLDPNATGKSAFFTVSNENPGPGSTIIIDAYYTDDSGNLARPTDVSTESYNPTRYMTKTINVSGANNNVGWNAARSIINNSLPSSSNHQTHFDTKWTLKVPTQNGYSTGSSSVDITVTGPANVTLDGVQKKAVTVKVGGYAAYYKVVS